MTEKARVIFKSQKSPGNVKKYNKADDLPDIEIRGHKKYDVMTFENESDFNDYHKLHLAELEGETTTVLNRKYKIPGFIISRSTQKIGKDEEGNDITKKILTLRRDGKSPKLDAEHERLEKIENKILDMTTAINSLGEQLNALIKYVSENN